jgi:hypothetical protein
MAEAGPITSFSITPTDTMNGIVNQYTFAVQALIPVIAGDKFTMTFPPEVTPPSDADIGTACKPINNIQSIVCTVDGQKVTFVIDDFVQSTGAFSWSIDGIKNPGSTRPSSPFADVQFTDADGFVVSEYGSNGLPDVTVTNQEPNQILIDDNSIEQQTKEAGAKSEFYKIKFTTTNAIPSTGSIQMTYPQQIKLDTDAECIVDLVGGFSFPYSADVCKFDFDAQTITIKNVFAAAAADTPYSDEILITLKNVENPPTNKPGNGFVI